LGMGRNGDHKKGEKPRRRDDSEEEGQPIRVRVRSPTPDSTVNHNSNRQTVKVAIIASAVVGVHDSFYT
jgi:hypothetical protein